MNNTKTFLTSMLLTAIALLLTTQAEAQSQETFCGYVEENAALTMELRQQGVRMSKVMSVAGGSLEEKIIKDAYGMPRHNTEFLMEVAVEEFANKWYRGCLEATND